MPLIFSTKHLIYFTMVSYPFVQLIFGTSLCLRLLKDHWDKVFSDPAIKPALYHTREGYRKSPGDIKGACSDWKKAFALGDKDACENLREFCKDYSMIEHYPDLALFR